MAAMLLAGCGTSTTHPPETSSQDWSAGLVSATDPLCAAQGALVVEYLMTGHTYNNPLFDQLFAQERADLLTQPKGSRLALARQYGDSEIQTCDANQAQASADASASAAASASASAAVTQAAAFKKKCDAVGGYVGWVGQCWVDFQDGPSVLVQFGSGPGGFDPAYLADQQQQCANHAQDAKDAADNGNPWTVLPRIDPRSRACISGYP